MTSNCLNGKESAIYNSWSFLFVPSSVCLPAHPFVCQSVCVCVNDHCLIPLLLYLVLLCTTLMKDVVFFSSPKVGRLNSFLCILWPETPLL